MRILFLGTSHGFPEANRKCSCMMLEVQGRYYIIDMGMMAMSEMATRGISVDAVKGIFISHLHGDHVDGLINFVDLISWYYKTANPAIFLPDMKAAKSIDNWLETIGIYDRRQLNYQQIVPGMIFKDDYIQVTAIETKHCDKSYSFLVEAEGKTMLFAGDLKYQNPAEDFPKIAREKEIDLAVCEGAHFSVMDYIPLISGSKIKKVCINHYTADNMENIQRLRKALIVVPVCIANDGLEMEV